MPRLLTILVIFFSFSIFAQSEIKITPKKCIPKKGYHLKLVKVLDDSRCPEGTTCVWAGEVSATVKVYKDRKFIEEKTLKFNPKNASENSKWFSAYYSKPIKSIEVLPYPKKGILVKAKKKYIRIVLED